MKHSEQEQTKSETLGHLVISGICHWILCEDWQILLIPNSPHWYNYIKLFTGGLSPGAEHLHCIALLP